MNPNSVHMPYGYVEKMQTLTATPQSDRNINFLMCGIPSPRRDRLVNELSEQGGDVYYPGMPVPVYVRDGLMEQARINLSFQKTDRHKIISVTRICHSVINRVPLFLETEFPDDTYARFCLTASPENPVAAALEFLAATDLEKWAEERYDELANNFPMNKFMEKVLNETVSL